MFVLKKTLSLNKENSNQGFNARKVISDVF